MIVGNMIGGYPVSPKTCVFVGEDGKEIHAILVDSKKVFTATTNDVRDGKTFATETGVKTGKKVIPAYHTNRGIRVIPAGSAIQITSLDYLDIYNFTKIQAILCDYNTNMNDSVAAIKVAIDENVYTVQSTDVVSVITKNHDDKIIDFGIVNDTDTLKILRFFTYKEIE